MCTACETAAAQRQSTVVAVGGHWLVDVPVAVANCLPQRPAQVGRQIDHVVTSGYHLCTIASHTLIDRLRRELHWFDLLKFAVDLLWTRTTVFRTTLHNTATGAVSS